MQGAAKSRSGGATTNGATTNSAKLQIANEDSVRGRCKQVQEWIEDS